MLSNGRMFVQPRFVDTNSIRMAVYEQGEGQAVIMLHGFPELAFSWRHQLPALAAAGYRAIAPDQRGYGKTSCPAGVDAYRIEELIADVHGLLDALRLDSAIFVGHDWGALLLWHMAVVAPERLDKLICLNIPHIPRPPIDPIVLMRRRFGDDYYIVNFQDSDEAEREFARDTHRFYNAVMRKDQIDRKQFNKLPVERRSINLLRSLSRENPAGKALLSDTELDYYAAAFAASGFTGPINWYRNWTHNWRALEGVDQTITIPTLFIGAANDVVVTPSQVEGMRTLIPDLEIHMLDNCGHWSQQEKPEEVNRVMLNWLMQHG